MSIVTYARTVGAASLVVGVCACGGNENAASDPVSAGSSGAGGAASGGSSGSSAGGAGGAGASSGGSSNGGAAGGAAAGSGGTPSTGPTADGVSGTLAPGQEVTIHWDGAHGFGETGPSVLLFDDFEGTPGETVPLTSPSVGAWSGVSASPPLFSDEVARSGKTSMLAWNATTQAQRQIHVSFDDAKEFLLSYWVRLPPGSLFPGKTAGVKQFSSDSSWKFTWLMDGPQGYGSSDDYDQCLPTHGSGNGGFSLAGNDGIWTYLDKNWWDWYEWIRITIWGRAAAKNPSVENGRGFFQTVSKNVGYGRRSLDDRPLFQGGTEKFNRLNVPGWIRTGQGGDQVKPHYDDVYFAVGPGSAARVEIGNAPSYDACTNLVLALPVAWSNEAISVKLQANTELASFAGAYLFVHDANDQLVGEPRAIAGN